MGTECAGPLLFVDYHLCFHGSRTRFLIGHSVHIPVFPVLTVVILLFLAVLWFGWRRVGARNNEVDWGGPTINRVDGFLRWFCRRYHRLDAAPIPVPATGPALVVANHVSGLDAFLLIAACRRPLRFIIATEEYQRPLLNRMFRAAGCIPVDRAQRPERAFRAALRALAAGEVVALFPHGAIHLDSEPPRALKKGVARLAQLADCPVFPVRIEGIKGEGHVVRGVLRRSRARLLSYPPINCHALPGGDCLHYISQHIEPHRH